MSSATLSVVDTETGEIIAEVSGDEIVSRAPDIRPAIYRAIPDCEGKPVSGTKLKVGSTASLDIRDAVLKVDDVVRVVVEARVTSVNHVVDEKTGELMRVQSVKAIDAEITPWTDTDNGVVQ